MSTTITQSSGRESNEMLVRVRSKNGTWRIENLSPQSTVTDVKQCVHQLHGIDTIKQRYFLDNQGKVPVNDGETLQSVRVGHGDLIYLQYDGDTIATGETTISRKVNADGSITHVEHHVLNGKKSFRPGLKALRDIKMHWTIGEFMRMDEEFEFKLKPQEKAHVAQVSLDKASCDNFQSYLRQFAFQQSRCGWLYGAIDQESKKVTVDFIYEPPQEGTPHDFQVFGDPLGEKPDAVAKALGREKVGWVFSHPPREDSDFHFSSNEILMAAQLQLDAGGKGSLFLSLKVTLDKEGQTTFEAFQVSDQCLDMFAAGALNAEHASNAKVCAVSETYTAIVEGKAATEIDNNFFLCVVPVTTHDSGLKSDFPRPHRQILRPLREALRRHLQKYRNETYIDRLKDFHLLLFLTDVLDLTTDIPTICQSIMDPQIPLDSGYQILIDSVAGT